MDGVPPVFVRETEIPDGDSYPKILDICRAVERSVGLNSVAGAQRLGGLWRIYPTTTTARNNILIQGFSFRNVTLKVCDTNPNILHDSTTGREVPTTKVFIDQVPLSVADCEIENALKKIGCELRSDIKKQRARDNDGKLTRFLTGKRFVFITLPPKPLERRLKIVYYNASIFHVEQNTVKKTVICSNCLQEGHHQSSCENDVVCKVCHESGHKSGSDLCTLGGAAARAEHEFQGERGAQAPASYADAVTAEPPREESSGQEVTCTPEAESASTQPQPRGRDPARRAAVRQSTLHFRPRSASVKRPSSSDGNNEKAEKSMRLETEPQKDNDDDGDGEKDTQPLETGDELC